MIKRFFSLGLMILLAATAWADVTPTTREATNELFRLERQGASDTYFISGGSFAKSTLGTAPNEMNENVWYINDKSRYISVTLPTGLTLQNGDEIVIYGAHPLSYNASRGFNLYVNTPDGSIGNSKKLVNMPSDYTAYTLANASYTVTDGDGIANSNILYIGNDGNKVGIQKVTINRSSTDDFVPNAVSNKTWDLYSMAQTNNRSGSAYSSSAVNDNLFYAKGVREYKQNSDPLRWGVQMNNAVSNEFDFAASQNALGLVLESGTHYITIYYAGNAPVVKAKTGSATSTLSGTEGNADVNGCVPVHYSYSRNDYETPIFITKGSGNSTVTKIIVSSSEYVTAPTISQSENTVTITSGSSNKGYSVTTYYTTDGSVPTSNSSVYSDVITLTQSCTIKAISISSESVSSEVASKSCEYTSTATTLTSENVSVEAVTYNGTEQTAVVKYNSTTLTKDTDYTVTTGTDVLTDAGNTTFTIEGTGNYAGTVSDLTFTITPKEVTVTSGITANNKVYDGNTTATLVLTGATIDGKVGEDELTVSSATGSFSDANVGENKDVTISDITFGGEKAGNYTLSATGNQTTTTATISQATNSLSGSIAIEGWTYGATANTPSGVTATFGEVAYKYSNAANGTYGTYNDIVNGAVGTWWVKAYVDGTKNYTAVESDAVSFTISAAQQTATITAEATQSTTYNGQAQSLTASVDQGTIIITYYTNEARTEGATTEAPINAGTYYAIVSQSDANYTSNPVNVTYTINKATLTATADNKSKMVGEDNPTLTVTVTGFVNGETADTADGYTAPTATTTADKDSEARTYDITVSGGAATNYTFTYVNGTLTVMAPVSDEYVSTTTSWVFNNLTTSTVYKSIANISNGIYVRGGESSGIANINRTFTVKDLASSQQVTFSDGYTVTISKYLETNGSFQNASSITTTTTAASTEMTENSPQLVGAGGMAFNTTVAGTLYVCMGLTEVSENDKKLRIYYNNGSAIASQTVSTKTTEIVEVKVTGAAGTYTFGCPDTKYRIYAIRFVPTSEAKAAWIYIGATGYTTFGNTTGNNLDLPEGLTAYSVKPGSTSATLTALNGIPQTAGVILKGTKNTNYALTASATTYSAESNYMVRVTADNTTIPQTEDVNSSTRYNYILQEDADEAQFTKASGSSVLAKGKAYFRSNKELGDNVGLSTAASQESINPSVSLTGWTYGEAANSPSVEGNTGDGTVTYTYYTDSNLSVPTTPDNSGAASDGSQPVNAGTYYIKAEIAASGNYLAGTATASFTVSKANLTATAADATRAVGEENPSFTVDVTGFVNGEDASTAAGYTAPTVSCEATTESDAGTYSIVPSGGIATNYSFTYVNGTLTVGNVSTYTITLPTAVDGNSVTANVTSATVGTEITLTITTAENYTLASINADNNVTLSGSDNTRTFTMPEANVTITATWTINQTDTGDSNTSETYTVTETGGIEVSTVTTSTNASSITIPAQVGSTNVTSIADDAFNSISDKSDIKSVDLSATAITNVEVNRESGVFSGFPEETMIYMPAGNTAVSGEKNVIIGGICSDFVMIDTKSYKIPTAFNAASATISRTFTNGTYCTLCLPFTIPSGNLSGKVYEFTGVSGETVTMTESNNGLQANKPYIFVPNANANGMTISDNSNYISINMNDSPHTVNSEANFTFKGVFENMDFSLDDISNGIYGFAAEANYGASIGQFVKAANGASIKGMRAYLAYDGTLTGTSTASTRGMVLPEVLNVVLVHANGGTTNIGKLKLMTAEDGSPVYNLNGQRVENNYKGIVIQKGKKVVKK